ncbi:hypothetical protein ANO11243_016510 [Dothideomycetidae sp. 11243]|nr:hypothetical protein ANO11243_016510 [fungal sp. No.11243]
MAQDGTIPDPESVPDTGDPLDKTVVTGDGNALDDHTNKRKVAKPSTVISQSTLRKPEWAYVYLRFVSPAALVTSTDEKHESDSIDDITVYMHIQSALKGFLGMHGTAMSVDLLKVDGRSLWVRVPREDVNAFVAAVGGWVGSGGEAMRVMNWGCWGPSESANGMDVFDD